jgi:hypothetical protein
MTEGVGDAAAPAAVVPDLPRVDEAYSSIDGVNSGGEVTREREDGRGDSLHDDSALPVAKTEEAGRAFGVNLQDAAGFTALVTVCEPGRNTGGEGIISNGRARSTGWGTFTRIES